MSKTWERCPECGKYESCLHGIEITEADILNAEEQIKRRPFSSVVDFFPFEFDSIYRPVEQPIELVRQKYRFYRSLLHLFAEGRVGRITSFSGPDEYYAKEAGRAP